MSLRDLLSSCVFYCHVDHRDLPVLTHSCPTRRSTDLVAATTFSFLRGASHPGEMVKVAVALKYDATGIADRNSVAGVVRAHVALKELREEFGAAITCRLLVGARIVFADDRERVV